MCIPYQYEFENVLFEVSRTGEPFRIKKNGDISMRKGKKFLEMFDRFQKLSNTEKNDYCIHGGCYSLKNII